MVNSLIKFSRQLWNRYDHGTPSIDYLISADFIKWITHIGSYEISLDKYWVCTYIVISSFVRLIYYHCAKQTDIFKWFINEIGFWVLNRLYLIKFNVRWNSANSKLKEDLVLEISFQFIVLVSFKQAECNWLRIWTETDLK